MTSDHSRSTNSKRSFDSITTNNNNGSIRSSDSNKRKKSNQKTLGVAWGATSASLSRSSSRRSPFTDFGSYMDEKNRKLHNQFDADASTSSHSSVTAGQPIFQGVSIFVDGFTIPSHQELRSYMLKHGGRFENYFSRRRVTHIICSNLADSKIKNLRSFSRGLPVVKPTWISDSVTANRLLSWLPYQLDQLADKQPKLLAFFPPRKKLVLEDASKQTNSQVNSKEEDPCLHGDIIDDTTMSAVEESTEQRKQIALEVDGHICNINTTVVEEPINGDVQSPGVYIERLSDNDADLEEIVNNGVQSSIQQPSVTVSSHGNDTQATRDIPSSSFAGPSKQGHSTLSDPNFVENYFKNSRLHFIGTWRNRYRQRFPNASDGFKGLSTGRDVSESAMKPSIIHIDMDCFFVSVVIRNHLELQKKPVAVCHSDNPKGTAEISSANYPARAYGVKSGMFVRDAKALCPHLVIIPYNFEAYEEVADQFYDILHKYCNKVQAVSCDEAFLDVTNLEGEDPELLASTIRKEILDVTGCSASAGIGDNMLMARLATRTAKPAGQFCIPRERVDEYLQQLPISVLPGIGHVIGQKLKKQSVLTCGQLRMISKDSLQKDFGMKTGEMLWNYSRGVDHRSVGTLQESKSICAEVNWGVRFNDSHDTQQFLLSLCKEVALRLQGCRVQGRTFTLKIKKRKGDAGEPVKYMGCGDCENLSRSVTVPVSTDDAEVLQRITKQLFASFHLDVTDIRGVGLQVSKLDSADTSRKGIGKNSLQSWLASPTAKTRLRNTSTAVEKRSNIDNRHFNSEGSNQISSLPALDHLDMEVIESLPPELVSELNETYGGKLINLIARNGSNKDKTSSSIHIQPFEFKTKLEGKKVLSSNLSSLNISQKKAKECKAEEFPLGSSSEVQSGSDSILISGPEMDDMLTSFSQVDTSVFQELPEELRAEIRNVLPPHRKQDFPSDANLGASTVKQPETLDIRETEDKPSWVPVTSEDLWSGIPPLWVDMFRGSDFCILNTFAEIYSRCRSPKSLSAILQHAIVEYLNHQETSFDDWNEAINNFCELFKQYIKLKIEVDIEEIYICFRLLRRLMTKSNFFLEVYNAVFPYLQVSVGETYGGKLDIP